MIASYDWWECVSIIQNIEFTLIFATEKTSNVLGQGDDAICFRSYGFPLLCLLYSDLHWLTNVAETKDNSLLKLNAYVTQQHKTTMARFIPITFSILRCRTFRVRSQSACLSLHVRRIIRVTEVALDRCKNSKLKDYKTNSDRAKLLFNTRASPSNIARKW